MLAGGTGGGKVKKWILRPEARAGLPFVPVAWRNPLSLMYPAAIPVGRSRQHGFTLVEIMVAIVLIGLLAALAIPAFQRVQRASQNGRLVNDLRVFAQAFEIYNSKNGSWPDGAAAGVVPTAPIPMSGEFKAPAWQSSTVIGGNWHGNGTPAISSPASRS